MLEAGLWGLVGGLALVLGALIALAAPKKLVGKRPVAYVMAFGAGVLISAVAFDLTEEAIELGGGDAAAIGLAGGALTFFFGDRIVERKGGRNHRRGGGSSDPGDGDPGGIVLGALLDGIPESAAIGLTLLSGGGVSVSFITAVFISNLPESISASVGLERDHSRRWIIGLWLGIAVASAVAAALGYLVPGRRRRVGRRGRQGVRRWGDPLHARRHDDAGGVRQRGREGRPRDRARVRPRGPAFDRLS